MVLDFHRAFGHPVAKQATTVGVTKSLRDLRIELIREEFEEFCKAVTGKEAIVWIETNPASQTFSQPSIVDVADALADMMYVIYGAALAYGVDLDEVFSEVHKSNMGKLGPEGVPLVRHDGKILKPEGWKPPRIRQSLESGRDLTQVGLNG